MQPFSTNVQNNFITEESVSQLTPVMQEFLSAYSQKPADVRFDHWLAEQLQKNLGDKSQAEIISTTAQIIAGVESFSANLQDLNFAIENGTSKEAWFSKTIQATAKSQNVEIQDFGNLMAQVYQVFHNSNAVLIDALNSQNGGLLTVDLDSPTTITPNQWNFFNTSKLAIDIAKQAALNGIANTALGNGFNLALTNAEPLTVVESVVIAQAISSGNTDEVKKTTAAALKVAIERGILSNIPSTVSTNTIANISALGIENTRILYSLGNGIISPIQAIDLTARNYVALVASINFEKIGAGVGAAAFSFIPIIGTTLGGVIGGIVGRVAGNKITQTISKGITKVASVAVSVAKKTWNSISSGVKTLSRGIRSIGRAVASFFGF